jgi:hypothetical protein
MSLDRQLWEDLQAHGITESHLMFLLRLLEVHRNGSWSWHYVGGQLTQCDAHLLFPGKAYEVRRVAEAWLGEGMER